MVRYDETKWTGEICEQLRKLGDEVFAAVASSFQQPGWPDRHVVSVHGIWWLEFKGVKTKVTAAQRVRIKAVNRRRPGTACVVRKGEYGMHAVETEDGELIANWYEVAELRYVLVRWTAAQQCKSTTN